MTTPLLYLLIAAVPRAGRSARRKRHPKQISTSEWLRRMRSLPPSAPPVLRYKGAAGVSTPERPVKAKKLALVKPARKNGTK
jgi:hypothetical protein